MPTDALSAGTILNVLLKAPARGGLLVDAELRQLGGRQFIVGHLADYGASPKDPRVGLLFWFSLDEVVVFTEYPDLATAQRCYQEGRIRERKSKGWFRK